MADEELRELERAARTGGPADALAWASALERLGRRDEALAALFPGRASPEVRRVLARFPAWTHAGATAGRSHALDLPPLEASARVLWQRNIARPEGWTSLLLTTPLGVVVRGGDGLLVLDPDTGETRYEVAGLEGSDVAPHFLRAVVAGDVLVLRQGRPLVGRDLWTGERLWRVELPADRTRVYPFEEPRAPPREDGSWSLPFDDADAYGQDLVAGDRLVVCTVRRTRPEVARSLDIAATRELVLLGDTAGLIAVDRAGRIGWTAEQTPPTLRADERGIVCAGHFAPRSVALDLEGKELWRCDVHSTLALGPDYVACVRPGGGALVRRPGQETVYLGRFDELFDRLAVARRVVTIGDADGLRAHRDTGELLWSVTREGLVAPFDGLALAPWRVYALTRGGTLACLGA